MAKKNWLFAVAVSVMASVSLVSNAQTRTMEVSVGVPLPTGDFSDWSDGKVSIGVGHYTSIPAFPNLYAGIQGSASWFDAGGESVSIKRRILEIGPGMRMYSRNPHNLNNTFNVYLQADVGAYFWRLYRPGKWNYDDVDFGASAGIGVTGRFTDRMSFFAQPTFTWINNADAPQMTYVPLNFGVMF